MSDKDCEILEATFSNVEENHIVKHQLDWE